MQSPYDQGTHCAGKTGNIVFSSCKYADCKGERYFNICRNKFPISSWISLLSQFCVCYSHKSHKLAPGKFAMGQGINRENTASLKMQFEWVPCYDILFSGFTPLHIFSLSALRAPAAARCFQSRFFFLTLHNLSTKIHTNMFAISRNKHMWSCCCH